MEATKKVCRKVLLGMMLCLVFSLGIGSIQAEAAVRLSKKKATITVGKTVKLKVKGTRKRVKWSSNKKSVCTVSKSGVVKGKKAGTATIKAKVGKKVLKCKVTVKKKRAANKPVAKPAAVKPTGLRVTGPYSKIAPGGTIQLKVEYLPKNAAHEAVEWDTSSSWRATVSDTGFVTAKETGEVTITAQLKSNYRVKGTFKLIIEDFSVSGAATSADGGDLILSEEGSRAVFNYTVSYTVPDVQTQVIDGIDNVIRTYPKSTLSPETPATVTWDLKDNNGNKVSPGSYCFQVVAAGTKIKSNYFEVYAKSEFDAGNGSAASPYQVSTLDQLKLVGRHNGVCFKQTADIDAGLGEVTPLFTADVPFTGTYDGNNCSIRQVSNSTTNASEIGIFSAVGKDGVVKNLRVEECNFIGAGKVAAVAGINNGTIDNCTVKGCFLTANNGTAGAISATNTGMISGCKTEGNALSTTDNNIGGICADNTGTVINCISGEDTLAATTSYWANRVNAGGVAGSNSGSILRCTINSVTLTVNSGDYTRAGGIAGYSSGTVANNRVEACEIGERWNLKGGVIGLNEGNITSNSYNGNLHQTGNQ